MISRVIVSEVSEEADVVLNACLPPRRQSGLPPLGVGGRGGLEFLGVPVKTVDALAENEARII